MKIIFIAFFALSSIIATAQQSKTAKIKIKYADSLYHNAAQMQRDIQALIGHVKLSHQEVLMYCDSAYLYRDSNMVEAFSNIHIIQNDTLHLYGDFLEYSGVSGIAKLRGNVKMVNKEVVLTTQFMDYDRFNNVGYYYNGGKVVSTDNTLTSTTGFYYPMRNELNFKDSVVVTNPSYVMLSDTLKYHTTSEVVSIVGPTEIVSDSNLIYSELGFYDTQNDLAQLYKNSYIKGKDQTLSGDTIYYNRRSGFGEVFSRMEIKDSLNQIIIAGNYGYYNEITQKALATKKAVLLQIHQGDTLFMHADTLKAAPIDTTDFKEIKAYHNVKFFRKDMQGQCDSMVFNMRDSINTMFHEPIIWAMGNQLTANKIKMFIKNGTFNKIELDENSFIVAPEDSSKFNQISGQRMTGYIKNSEIYKIDVDGNGQTIYFPKDDKLVIGVNKAESSNLTLHLKNRQIDKLVMRVTPTGNLKPPLIIDDETLKLKGFYWLEEFRPKKKEDIFKEKVIPTRDTGETENEYQFSDEY